MDGCEACSALGAELCERCAALVAPWAVSTPAGAVPLYELLSAYGAVGWSLSAPTGVDRR